MKILIIDDSISTARTIMTMLMTLFPEIEQVEMVSTEGEARDKMVGTGVELVMISTMIKGTDGYELAEALYRRDESLVILLYGEEEAMQDVRKMLHCHAFDYLALPLTRTSLHFALEAAKDEIHRNKERMQNQIAIRDIKLNELVEFSFIYSVLFNGDMNWDWKEYQELLGFRDSGYVLYISLERSEDARVIPYETYSALIKQNVTSGYRCIVGKEITRRIIVFVMCKNEKEHIGSKMEQIRFGEYIRKSFRDLLDENIKVGIGSERTIEQLPISYEEAMRNLSFDGYAANNRGYVIESEQRNRDKFCMEQEQKFLTNIREGSSEALNNLRTILDLLEGTDVADKKNKIVELLVMASHIARYDGKNENINTNYIELVRQLDQLEESSLNAWACRTITYIIKSVRDLQTVSSFSDIRKALRYVDTHYDEDISLEEVAAIISVSPQYFSRIFKEKAGITFVDYLTKVRIRKAKEWLSYSENTIQEICYKVGYKDPNYFARVFKKIVGVTPKQFKARKESSDVS